MLRDASLAVGRGEWVALLGRSGSGKSTLLNLISGIDLPDRGDVAVAGTPLNRLSERERTLFRRDHIGFVFQFYNLIPTLTVEENLLLPLELAGRLTRAHHDMARDLLEQVGLAEHAYKTPAKISGGQQQRVALARALANDPAVVLADEPTGNLDSRTAGEIYALFGSLLEHNKTLLVVTHDKEVARQATRSIEIADGKVLDVQETALSTGWG